MTTGHLYVHGGPEPPYGHTLYYCPTGYAADSNEVVEFFTGKSGTIISSALTFFQTEFQIIAGKPIISIWKYYDGGNWFGHSLVTMGYSLNNDTGDFTYIHHDSNYINSNQYSFSSIYDSSVIYEIGGNDYEWQHSIYNWN